MTAGPDDRVSVESVVVQLHTMAGKFAFTVDFDPDKVGPPRAPGSGAWTQRPQGSMHGAKKSQSKRAAFKAMGPRPCRAGRDAADRRGAGRLPTDCSSVFLKFLKYLPQD